MVLMVAGPNGAGKSTLAPVFLRESFSVRDYVNADTIAQGLSAFASEEQAFRAGRVMIARLRDFAEEGRSFAFESTLATRSYAPWLGRLVENLTFRASGLELFQIFRLQFFSVKTNSHYQIYPGTAI
jgi:predicted ABC-type ATPase